MGSGSSCIRRASRRLPHPPAPTSGPRLEIRRSVFAAATASTSAASNCPTKETVMGKIVINTNASLDGVVQDPTGEEGFRLGGWFTQFGGEDLEDWAKLELDEALRTDALLLGRRSDEWFAARWSSRSGEW